jgi:putative transcriptional regulator
MANLERQLLVASPSLTDEWFAQTVVLLVAHNDNGAFGVVLNRPTYETVGQVWNQLGGSPCNSNQPANVGGPVDGPIMALHTEESFADIRVVPNVFLAVQRDNLDWVVHQTQAPFRLFLGTASWSPNQLEEELQQGAWLVTPATSELLFAPPDDLWAAALRKFGRDFYTSLGIRGFPRDAMWN